MRALGAAGASGATAPRGPGGRRDCAGNGVRPHDATPGAPRVNTLDRSSAGRGRSGCTAAPARGNARTRTGGRDGRPAAGSSGGLPRHASALQCRVTPDSGIHCHRIPLHRRGVGHGVRFQLPRQEADAVPAYHSGTAHVVPHSPSSAAHQSTRPVRQAALQGGLPDDFPRAQRSAQKRRLAAAYQKRRLTTAWPKALSRRRISALPDRRSQRLPDRRCRAATSTRKSNTPDIFSSYRAANLTAMPTDLGP